MYLINELFPFYHLRGSSTKYSKNIVLKHGYVTEMKAYVNYKILRLSTLRPQPYSSRNTVLVLIYENAYVYVCICENLCVLHINIIAVHEKNQCALVELFP